MTLLASLSPVVAGTASLRLQSTLITTNGASATEQPREHSGVLTGGTADALLRARLPALALGMDARHDDDPNGFEVSFVHVRLPHSFPSLALLPTLRPSFHGSSSLGALVGTFLRCALRQCHGRSNSDPQTPLSFARACPSSSK